MKKINIDVELFTQKYSELSINDVALYFNISVGTVHNYAKKLGLSKGSGCKATNILIITDIDS